MSPSMGQSTCVLPFPIGVDPRAFKAFPIKVCSRLSSMGGSRVDGLFKLSPISWLSQYISTAFLPGTPLTLLGPKQLSWIILTKAASVSGCGISPTYMLRNCAAVAVKCSSDPLVYFEGSGLISPFASLVLSLSSSATGASTAMRAFDSANSWSFCLTQSANLT